MKNKSLFRKSSSSNPSIHWHQFSHDLNSHDLLSPKPGSSRATVTRGLKRMQTPRSDLVAANSGFFFKDRVQRVQKDFKPIDIYATHTQIEKPPQTERIPIDRQDAKELLMWLDEMLQQILQETTDPDLIFEKAHKIYQHCMTEVVKQVSVQCKERGMVIERVWRAYQTVFERSMKTQQVKINSLEEKHSNDKTLLHKMYNKQLRKLELKFQETDKKLIESQKIIKDQEILCNSLKVREENLKGTVKTIQGRYKNAKREVLLLKEELRVLNFQIQNYSGPTHVKPSSLTKLHHRIKVKNQVAIEKELDRDPVMADTSHMASEDTHKLLEHLKVFESQQNERFTVDDFKDIGTDAMMILKKDSDVQTNVEDLCGETVGVKKRRNNLHPKLSTLSSSPMPLPSPLSRSNSMVFSQAEPPTNLVESKKKHERLKGYLQTFKTVSVK